MTTKVGRLRPFAESVVEDAALAWLEELGNGVLHDSELAPSELHVLDGERVVGRCV